MKQIFSSLSDALSSFFAELSKTEVVFLFIIIFGLVVIYKLILRLLDDRQKELNRLAKDNHDYRDRFERLNASIERLHALLEKRYTDAANGSS